MNNEWEYELLGDKLAIQNIMGEGVGKMGGPQSIEAPQANGCRANFVGKMGSARLGGKKG